MNRADMTSVVHELVDKRAIDIEWSRHEEGYIVEYRRYAEGWYFREYVTDEMIENSTKIKAARTETYFSALEAATS